MKYQLNYSDIDQTLYDQTGRKQKANKIISVLSDFYKGELATLKLLDIGSSTGIITNFLSKYFSHTTGVDIDEKAVEHAKSLFENEKLHFQIGDSMKLPFNDNSFDVVNCTQVYEHVPNSEILISEIYRVLKPNGVCFFSAGNRIVFIEGHYNLPLLSVIPKWLAHIYLKVLKRGDFYYENHLTYWGLKKLTSKFQIIDYSEKIILDPVKFAAIEMIQVGSLKQKMATFIVRYFYCLFPNYIWILKKPLNSSDKK